jgi:hypothetical protein
MSTRRVSIFAFSLQKNKWKSCVFDLDRKKFRIVDSTLKREGMPLQRDQPRAREKPRTVLSVCQKVIVKKRKSSAANFLQVLLMLQCSASKLMTTLMVTGAGRTRNLQDLVFMVQRKGFGVGVVSGLRPCVFLQMLLDLPHLLSHCFFPRLLPGIFSKVKFYSRKSSFPGLSGARNMRMEETIVPGPNFNRPVKDLVYKDLLTITFTYESFNVECHMDPNTGKTTIGKERTVATCKESLPTSCGPHRNRFLEMQAEI